MSNENIITPEGMNDSFIGPYESTPESTADTMPNTPEVAVESRLIAPEVRATATKKLMFLYVGETVGGTYTPYTTTDIANFGGVTEFVLCAGAYGPYGTGPFTGLRDAMKSTLATIISVKGANARVWISTPPMPTPSNSSFSYPTWTGYLKTYIDSLRNSSSGISVSDWNTYVKGIYMHSERIFSTGTAFGIDVNYSNLLAHPQIKLFSDIGSYARTASGSYNAKELMWCPYYGYGAYEATIIKDVGYVANTTNIFNTVILQPSHYFQDGLLANLDAIRETIRFGYMTWRRNAQNVCLPVVTKTSSTQFGCQMEVDSNYFSVGTPWTTRYNAYLNYFNNVTSPIPNFDKNNYLFSYYIGAKGTGGATNTYFLSLQNLARTFYGL